MGTIAEPVLKSSRISRRDALLDATIRDFSGGWNVVDNDLNLDTKFSKILENMQRGLDGSNSVRPGTKLFAETSEYLDEIINCEYYNNFIVAVGKNGKMVSVDAGGVVREIWSDEWANNLTGNPDGWDATSFVSFAIFNGELIICNGVNKPVIVNTSMVAIYLKDLVDDNNSFVPIARFVIAHGRYLVMAGSLSEGLEDRLFISSTDTSGTWVGNSAPNDSITLDLGSRVPTGSHTIKGLGKFRDQLMVLFEDAILPGTLGVFVSAVHTPTFNDAIENVGGISHRISQTVGDDMIFGDVNGVASVKRALITGSVTSDRASTLIDPDYHVAISNINNTVAQEDKIWSLWDSANTNYMLFIPDAIGDTETTEYRCMVYKRNKQLKIDAWQDWRGWKFRSGCRSALKDIFMTEGTQIYRLGDQHTDSAVYKDYEGDQEMFDDDTSFTDYTGWNPVADIADSGVPIRFIWELPWSDNKDRFLTKSSRYISFDTVGDNTFTVEMFIDNIYEDESDFGEDWIEDELKFDDETGWDVDVLDPTLSITFVGGTGPGFGSAGYGKDFGGGRPTRLEKLYAWPARYKLQKLRFTGDATKPLKFVSITLAYLKGSPRRV
jgi:hypothetical protein